MVYKSLFLSIAITVILGYCLTVGLTSPNSLLKKMPDWASYVILIACFFLYILATWWGIKGFGEHRMAAICSLGLCIFGLGGYALAFIMEAGHGKASPGQYDYSFSRLDPTEKSVLEQIVQGAGLTLQDATFSEHWHIAETTPGFRVCVQKGHITALHFSGKKIADLALFSGLPQLGGLYMDHCGLADMSALQSEKIDRLELPDNQISDLKTLRGCPNVEWLVLRNNQLQSEEGIDFFTKLVSRDFSGNPYSK